MLPSLLPRAVDGPTWCEPIRGAWALREILPGIVVGMLLAGVLQGCSISPAEQEAIRRAWEERDAERAQECQRAGRGFVAGGCTGGGGP
jgi:hypothetical protein